MKAHTFAAFAGLALASAAIAQPGLQGLGLFDSGTATPSGAAADVSDDGTIVVGSSFSYDPANPSHVLSTTFRWTAATGMQMIRSSPSATFGGGGRITPDGSAFVGSAISWTSFPAQQAMWYSSATGINLMGDFPGGSFGSVANDISDDGQIIVGWGMTTTGSDTNPFKWTAATGLVMLPGLRSPSIGQANAISGDGTVIVGTSKRLGSETDRAVRWTSSGITEIGASEFQATSALAVSHDGSVVAGTVDSPAGGGRKLPFRWTQPSGLVVLPNPAATDTRIRSMTPDGSLMVGYMYTSTETAFIWDALNGFQDLNTIATSRGIDLAGWTLKYAAAITPDGLTIVGQGTNPSGQAEPYILRLPVPPVCGTSDFNGDGDYGTDSDIEAFFACLGGECCPTCFSGASDFNGDGDYGTDADIEAFFRVLGGGPC